MKQLINRVFRPLGVEIRRVPPVGPEALGTAYLVGKYRELVTELYECLGELVFRDLPDRDGRRDLLAKLIGTPLSEAMYIVAHLTQCLGTDGDVCEFGVAQGATSALLANEIRSTTKHLWLFDSFQGLPKPTEKDTLINDIFGLGSIEKYHGTMVSPVEMVQEQLAQIGFPQDRTHIVPGFIEETMRSAVLPAKVCFAYVDFDFYEPILVTLRLLQQRLPVRGTVIVDDYGFFSSGAQTAVDEFVAETRGQYEMTLPLKCAAVVTPFCILRRVI